MKTISTLLFFLFVFTSNGQETPDVSLTDFVRESQQWCKQEDKMKLGWWIPKEYWKIALAGNTQIPEGTIEQLESIFEGYVLVCAANMNIGKDGTTSFSEKSVIRESILIVDQEGKKYKPIADEEVSPEAQQVVESIKPMFEQALGQMGKGMHLFFFVVQNDKKENLIDAAGPGEFKLSHSGCELIWKLPMVTLLPAKTCPVDNEKMKGGWKFCPVHGTKLPE